MAIPPAVVTALSIAGTVVGAVGQIAQGNAQARALDFNAQQRMQDAQQARLNAAEEERRIRRDNRLRLGNFAASRGASGVTAEGSALDVFADAAAEGELRALDARYGGLMAARAAEQDAAFMRMQAKSTRRNALFGAGGTILGGALDAGGTLLGSGTTPTRAGIVRTPSGIRPGVTAGGRRYFP